MVFLFCLSSIAQNNKMPAVDISEFKKIMRADSSDSLVLSDIIISGNKKTKDYILLREMNMKVGDTIKTSILYEKLLLSQQAIYNTNLFSYVIITPTVVSAFKFKINIKVAERWYIYPVPQFQIIDRNFNEWFYTNRANLNRVIYGMKYKDYNFSGRADKLNAVFLNGYNRYFALGYSEPYSNKKLNEGFSVGIGYSQSKEFAYKTDYNNKLIFYRRDFFVKNNFFISGTYFKRIGLYKKHLFAIQYNTGSIADSFAIKNYNPNYLNDSTSRIEIPDFIYSYIYTKTDNINYPLKGTIFIAGIGKRGLGITGGLNMLSADIVYRKFFQYKNNFYSSVQLAAKIKLPLSQAYINQRALGFGDYYLRGLEYYVVDGTISSVTKFTFSKKLIQTKIPLPFKNKTLSHLPFSVYAKSYTDAGFAFNKKSSNTLLNNKLLYTGGIGIDILSLYDMKLTIEYSFNQLNQNGLFFHSGGML